MSRPRSLLPRIAVGLALLLLVLMIVTLVSSLEKVERTERIPPEAEARRNPLLASERFLNEMGLQAHSTRRLDSLPPTDRMLVLAMKDRLLTESDANELVEWIAGGGYLVVGPQLEDGEPTSATQSDRLLDQLGVGVQFLDDVENKLREPTEIGLLEGEPALEVEFYSAVALSSDSTEPTEEGEPGGLYDFVGGEIGDGLYLVLTDLEFLRSDQVGKLDHAAFLWAVARFGGARQRVQLVHGMEHASIWSLIGSHAWPLLLSTALLLGALAWRRAARFGPTMPLADTGSRALIDHVDGLGWFLWRRRRADALIDSARAALRKRMLARRPDLARADRYTQLQILTEGRDIAADGLYEAMFGRRSPRRDDYTKTIRTLERLRREL